MADTGRHSETDALAQKRDLFAPAHADGEDHGKAKGGSYFWASLRLAAHYVRSSIRRDKHSFCVGLATVALVVAFSALVQSAVDNSQVVFLKLSEDTAGEGDLVLLPDPRGGGAPSAQGGGGGLLPSGILLNDTELSSLLSAVPSVAGVVPRWTALGRVFNSRARTLNTSTVLLIVDSAREESIGLGRTWGRRPLGPTEAYVSSSALDETGVEAAAGEQVTVELSLGTLAGAAGVGGTGAGDAAGLLSTLASLGVEIGTPDGQGGRSLRVDATVLLRAAADSPLLRALGITPELIPPLGDVTLNVTALLDAALSAGDTAGDATGAGATDLLTLSRTLTVVDRVEAPGGKWPAFLGNVVVLEARHVAAWLGASVAGALDQVLAVVGPAEGAVEAAGGSVAGIEALRSLRDGAASFGMAEMRQFALQEYVVMRNRMALYLGDPNGAEAGVGRMADDVAAALGPEYPAQVTAPLSAALGSTRFIKLFLDQVFGTVVFILGLLGCLVVFALVLGNVEEKTYEYGMLRALGLRHRTLSQLLAMSSASFSVPGILIGLVAASALHGLLLLVFFLLTATAIPPTMSTGAWVLGLTLGVVMPACAIVVPIRRALSSTLRDSLDLYHQTINQVTVTLRRLADVGISATESVIAVVLVLVGFVTFYALPLAFANGQLPVFLGILSAVLIGMLLGLSVVGATLQPTIETAVASLILRAACQSRLSTVVAKNLAAHRRRNSKTAYMVSMSIAFILFAGAMFALQAESIGSNFRLFLGADLVVFAPSVAATGAAGVAALSPSVMPQEQLTAYLQGEVRRSDAAAARASGGQTPAQAGALVRGFTYISQPASRIAPLFRTDLSPLTLDPVRRAAVVGLQRNYLAVAYDEFTVPTETAPGSRGGAAIVEDLHDGAGRQSLPIEAGTAALLGPPRDVTSSPGFAPIYACSQSSWAGAAAEGGANATFATWRPCEAACPGRCAELPAVNRSLADAAAASVYRSYTDAIASESVRSVLSIDTTTGAVLGPAALDRRTDATSRRLELVKLRAVASKMAGFGFSPYSQVATNAPLLVRGQDVARMVDRATLALSRFGRPPGSDAWGPGAVPAAFTNELYLQAEAADRGAAAVGSDPARNAAYRPAGGDATSRAWVGGAGRGWGAPSGGVPLASPDPPSPGGGNASLAYDGDVRSAAFLPVSAGAPWVRVVASPACPLVSGVRLWRPAAADRRGRQATGIRVEAAATVGPGGAAWTRVAEGPLAGGGEGGGWASLTWREGYSAPHWRVVLTSWGEPAAAGALAEAAEVSELQLLAAAGDGACRAERLAAEADDSSPGVPKERLMVRLHDGVTPKQRSRVVNALRNLLPDDSFRVEDTAALLTAASTAIEGLNAFFYIVAALCLVLCFFAVWLSFEANIRENSREIGILRSLGLTKPDLRLLVASESLGVVSAAFLEGSVIGMAISISLTLQFNLFTQLPFVFRMPTVIFVGSLVACVLVALAGSLLPLRRYLLAEIAPVAKGRTA